MGGSVSAGRNNDELIDHLVEAEFIKTKLIQRVFRAVDRGNYYLDNQKQNAYKDIAWRIGNLHLSAPCVYSVVLEALKLKPGLSFLNIGSGTGYLSTVAGLILGVYGVNHGIELHSDVVDFASNKLEEFLLKSHAINQYDFCEPTFIVGNCLSLDTCHQYDRVYCGASCPEEYEQYIKNLVKVGGILIMPLNEKLLKITRTSETEWHSVKVLSVSFAPLVSPPISSKLTANTVKLCNSSPPLLQNICRAYIRSILRDKINKEHPDFELYLKRKEKRPRRQVRRIVIPFYDDTDLSASQSNSEADNDSDGEEFTLNSRLPSRMSLFLEDFLRRHAELQLLRDMQGHGSSSDSEALPDLSTQDPATIPSDDDDQDLTSSELISLTLSNIQQSSSDEESSNFSKPPSQSTRSRKKQNLKRKRQESQEMPSTSSQTAPEPKKKAKHTSSATVILKKFGLKGIENGDKEFSLCDDDYSNFLIEKIEALPLPSRLTSFLSYCRKSKRKVD